MNIEEYENKGFPIRNFLLRLILVIIFALILVWLLPKFITPTVVTKECSKGETCDTSALDALTSQIFSDNMEKMKKAAVSYYTDERLPKEVGATDEMTLSDMIGKKLITPLIDKNNKAVDVEKSYVKITKLDDEYLLKVNLKDSEKEDYILVHLGCYTYCSSYVCEKRTSTDIPIKDSKVNTKVPVKTPTSTNKTIIIRHTTKDDTCKGDECNPQKPKYDKEKLYEYTKTTNQKTSKWTKWSDWEKVNCSEKNINCDSSNPSCTYKQQIYKRKEQIGTYRKAYKVRRDVLKQTGSYEAKTCSKYNYVRIDDILYATTTTTTYTTVNNITATLRKTSGGWTYVDRYKVPYNERPTDTINTKYIFAGADYSACTNTCGVNVKYYYDKYVYTGGMKQVSTTTEAGDTTSSTDTDTKEISRDTTYDATCGEYTTKTVPIYSHIKVSDIAYRKEPLYGTVCYKSTKSRNVIKKGSTYKKWSKYDDRSLLDNDWTYTGKTKDK